jgi:hypothetical protein
MSAAGYFEKFSKLSQKASYFHIFLLLPRQLIRRERGFLSDWIRFVQASRIPIELLAGSKGKIPEIELLTVVSGKDIKTLRLSLLSAAANSFNSIERVTVICPKKDLSVVQEATNDIERLRIEITDEDTLISYEVRDALRQKFGQRYGWVLQQLLTVQHVLKSTSAGVLTINSDTILTRKQLWINEFGKQILMRSHEWHAPYYILLKKMGLTIEGSGKSHITHHMLMQPKLFRAIIKKLGIRDLSDLAHFVIENADPNEVSPICVEFELYAFGLINFFEDSFIYRKFSNLGLSRNENKLMISPEHYAKQFADYNSVSLHSYS